MSKPLPRIAVLGASGLIGQVVASELRDDGFPVVPIARRFTSAQKASFGGDAVEVPIVDFDAAALAHALSEADIVVNCIGMLQDRISQRTDDVHSGFANRLVEALVLLGKPVLLLHISIPGKDSEDRTPFSLSKRDAERVIVAGKVPFVILRPGFVVATAAFGGSALVRALAALPFDLPPQVSHTHFAVADVGDIAKTIAMVAKRWGDGEQYWNVVWNIMERRQSTMGEVVDAFRKHLGGPATRISLPSWLMEAAAKAGDLVALLGWAPPVRSTALSELRRGVEGNPEGWISKTGIEPTSMDKVVQGLPVTVQEKWFARLYLAKALVVGSLVVFWSVSGLIAISIAFDTATAILTSHGVSLRLAQAITVASSLTDIGIGAAIAFRKTCRIGLLVGIAVATFYLVGAAVTAPDLWVEPLGALVKTVPTIVLMLVALAVLENR